MINRGWRSVFCRQAIMDVEAALLENSPTLSTISSDCTDTTYSGPGSPYSPESPIIVTSSYKKTKDDEVTPRPTPRHPLPPRKPNFRIRPPYLMICISIVEVTPINFFVLVVIVVEKLFLFVVEQQGLIRSTSNCVSLWQMDIRVYSKTQLTSV